MKKTNYMYELFVPYRVCPLGAHIDHQLGIVTGFTLDKGITMKYSATKDGSFHVISHDFMGEAIFTYDELPKMSSSWHDYLIGSILALQENYDLIYGINAYIEKTLPVGGLASSSAIIISYVLALSKVNHIHLEEQDIVSLVFKVESEYLNTKVGIMDPSCELYCKKDSLLYLDTKNKTNRLIKANKDIDFKICLIYSGISRRLPNTIYNIRVDECKTTAFILNSILQNSPIQYKQAYLRNFSLDEFEKNKQYFPMNHIKRAMHFYGEMDRIQKGINYFEQGDLVNFGKLVFESGTSSIENYETGSEQLETLHEIAKKTKGIYGGRFSGAGFNGYYMAIIDPAYEDSIQKTITEEYLKIYPQYKDEFKIYICNVKEGVKR